MSDYKMRPETTEQPAPEPPRKLSMQERMERLKCDPRFRVIGTSGERRGGIIIGAAKRPSERG